ncbi:TIGR04206 family protein [Halobacteriales archaeon QS_8_69_26]|nr:MAG: TIGR04206 family protein [Halobacteriales archaeon QS_8_69_26]
MVVVLALLPWTVVVHPGGVDLVFGWGLVNTNPLGVVDLPSYLFVYTPGPRSLPSRLVAWPGSTALFVLAVASASLGVVGREDRRVTAALLALAGLVHLRVALGLVRVGGTALPVGSALMLGTAWWVLGRPAQ